MKLLHTITNKRKARAVIQSCHDRKITYRHAQTLDKALELIEENDFGIYVFDAYLEMKNGKYGFALPELYMAVMSREIQPHIYCWSSSMKAKNYCSDKPEIVYVDSKKKRKFTTVMKIEEKKTAT